MPARNEEHCDVVVIGGGPAGSSAATMLAKAGKRVILLERERFPRFHTGESLLSGGDDKVDMDQILKAAGEPEDTYLLR